MVRERRFVVNFSAEGIAAIIVALAGLLSGLYNLVQARKVQSQQDLEKAEKQIEELKTENRGVERLLEIAMRHIHTQNLAMARNGLESVPLPKELT